MYAITWDFMCRIRSVLMEDLLSVSRLRFLGVGGDIYIGIVCLEFNIMYVKLLPYPYTSILTSKPHIYAQVGLGCKNATYISWGTIGICVDFR
ncbi:hypothetical protein VNO77_20692 [Canavalia gladiata]|uniref:Uncharacterized protein n=1 Tax=Canavalia gladiata TaxID=3824 RepID=A0AAN9LQL2_CANGL